MLMNNKNDQISAISTLKKIVPKRLIIAPNACNVTLKAIQYQQFQPLMAPNGLIMVPDGLIIALYVCSCLTHSNTKSANPALKKKVPYELIILLNRNETIHGRIICLLLTLAMVTTLKKKVSVSV